MAKRSKTRQKITIKRLAHGGDGIGYLEDGRIIFVPKTLPGEVVEVELTTQKKSFARGNIVEIIEASTERIAPECPYFGECGGCQFWHTNYAHELNLKATAAHEAIGRIGGFEPPKPAIIAAPDARRYRTKVTFHQKCAHRDRRSGKEFGAKFGFYRAQSAELLEIDDCLITDALLNRAQRALRPALRDVGDCDVILETADASSIVASLVPARDFGTNLPASLRKFAKTLPQNPLFRGLRIVGETRDVVVGDISVDAKQILAQPPVDSGRLTGGDFRQSFRAMNRKLVATVCQIIEQRGAKSVLELYCGSGNLSLAVAPIVHHLTGIEGSAKAVENAQAMAKLAGLEQCEFHRADLSTGVPLHLKDELASYDLLLLDPPRAGAAKICEQLSPKSGPTAIVYVSCDPACLGRDLKKLTAAGWTLDSLTMLDLFPRTAHIETIAVLSNT